MDEIAAMSALPGAGFGNDVGRAGKDFVKGDVQYRIMIANATISVCTESPYGAIDMLPAFMASPYEPNCGGFYP